jgi:hypothetical protein
MTAAAVEVLVTALLHVAHHHRSILQVLDSSLFLCSPGNRLALHSCTSQLCIHFAANSYQDTTSTTFQSRVTAWASSNAWAYAVTLTHWAMSCSTHCTACPVCLLTLPVCSACMCTCTTMYCRLHDCLHEPSAGILGVHAACMPLVLPACTAGR